MAPSWMAISKLFWNSVCSRPKSRLARIKCPVEEIGRNSVKPSTTPRMMACSRVMAAFQPWTECACRRDEGPQADYPQDRATRAASSSSHCPQALLPAPTLHSDLAAAPGKLRELGDDLLEVGKLGV